MRKLSVSIFIVFTALIASAGPWSQSAQDLFQKALTLEREVGNLQEAISLYEKVVAASGEAELAARAQLRIGICYEKLGMQEAQNAFQKVIDNYPRQLEEVRAAKERIARLARATREISAKPSFRKIQIPANPGNGVLSPDGKRLAFASEGSLWVVPIPGNVDPDIAGTPVRLTEPIGANNVENTLAWSADGKWIAFNTSPSDSLADPNSIFVVPSAGGPVKMMPIQPDGIPRQRRLSLSPEAKILAFAHGQGIYALSIDSGEGRLLAENNRSQRIWGDPAFSPDGFRVAYVSYSRYSPGKKDVGDEFSLWVTDLAGNAPVKIVEMSGFLRGPTWSPDGSMIAFTNKPADQVNDRKLCIVPASGRASAPNEPLVIELPLEPDSILAGWTSQNSIGAMLGNPPFEAVYTVPSSGGRATQVSPAGLTVTHPRWSPDGRRIFYRGLGIFSIPSHGGPVETVLARGKRGELYEATAGGGNNVSPDGKKLVFSGAINISRSGDQPSHVEVNIYTIPVKGGQPTQITTFPWDPENPWVGQARFPCWSPDGKMIAFIRDHYNEQKNHMLDIFTVPAAGGEVRQISSESDRVAWAGIDWSPDGKTIAYYSTENAVHLLPIEGGPAKSLTEVVDIGGQMELSWSPDGERIAYSNKGKIYLIPAGGGQPVELKTGLDAEMYEMCNLAWSPDGRTIAFAANKSDIAELYLVEDFLPLLKKGRK
jgi:Tol biopolymer transport system component